MQNCVSEVKLFSCLSEVAAPVAAAVTAPEEAAKQRKQGVYRAFWAQSKTDKVLNNSAIVVFFEFCEWKMKLEIKLLLISSFVLRAQWNKCHPVF